MNTPIKILLVDDETHVLTALRRTLVRAGYEVSTAVNPNEGLALLHVDEFDLVISDYMMPLMNGLEFLAVVAQRQPRALRLLLTGQIELDRAQKAFDERRIYRCLLKPWDDFELRQALALAIAHRDALDQAIPPLLRVAN